MKNNKLKTLAILDIVIDVILIGSLWYFVSLNHDLKVKNQILTQEAISQENNIITKDNYINYLENIVIECETYLYNK